MARAGRPALLDPEFDGQREKMLDYLRTGMPSATAIAASGLGRSTVMRAIAHGKGKKFRGRRDGATWAEFREFRDTFVQARAVGLATLHAIVVKGTKKSPALALRLLSRLDPTNYNPEVMVRYAAIEAGLEDDASALRARAGVTVRRERKK